MTTADPTAGQTPTATALPPVAVGLPPHYLPRVAGYARGPFLDARLVTPSDFRWRNARTYVVETVDGVNYRALRVTLNKHHFGWWAVELLGVPLVVGGEPDPLDDAHSLTLNLSDGRSITLPPGWRELVNE